MKIDWLASFVESWRGRIRSGRTPHAVMLSGPRGSGKRAAAAWIAATRVAAEKAGDLPDYPFSVPEHPDVYWVSRAEDKQSIAVDQIRGLVADLSLTSYQGHGKTAVIEPADLMNNAAANSLLKTLEEPSGDALLLLVVDRMGRLPATIVSRCQRMDFRSPPPAEALSWLERVQAGEWERALKASGGAPLAALEMTSELERNAALLRDLNAVGARQASPVEVAARWAKEDPFEVLEWFAREIGFAASGLLAGSSAPVGEAIDETVVQRMDTRNLFCYLDIINRLRGRPRGAFNPQTAFEGLLIDWAGGLRRLQAGGIDAQLGDLYSVS
ncbi:MAG: hypothetical protein AAFX56_00255 [Pseudomonadota bacterium]